MPRRSSQSYSFKRGKGCLHCRQTGYMRPHRRLRGAAHDREAPATGDAARARLARDLQDGARGRACAPCARRPSRRSSAASPPRRRWCGSRASKLRLDLGRWRATRLAVDSPHFGPPMSRPVPLGRDATRRRKPARQGRARDGQRPRPRRSLARTVAGSRARVVINCRADRARGGPGRGDPARRRRGLSAAPTSATSRGGRPRGRDHEGVRARRRPRQHRGRVRLEARGRGRSQRLARDDGLEPRLRLQHVAPGPAPHARATTGAGSSTSARWARSGRKACPTWPRSPRPRPA